MNPSISTLNPHAESYIPLAKREVKNEDEGYKTSPGEVGHPVVDDLKLKGQQVDDPLGSPSQIPGQMESIMDEESEMDLAYLQMIFPGVSDQSLVDVYNVNGGDLEAAIDMLNHFESADNPLDALDIEAAQKPIPSGECSSTKGLTVTGDSSSSSGSSDLAVPT